MNPAWTQSGYGVRFDWGPAGAQAVGAGAAIVAVVDVLSFTTTLSVAADAGIAVRPYRWRDETAEQAAREHDAVLAVGRRQAVSPGQVSLSPATIRRSRGIERLVLPSPNGATISALLAEAGATVVGVSLRNAVAAAEWVARRSGVVAVIAAGERWPDGSLRPAVEDLWGAGAFLDALVRGGAAALSCEPSPELSSGSSRELSPEAEMALAAYRSMGSPGAALSACASGRELHEYGFPEDVAIAAEAGASAAVPVLAGGWFVPER